MRIDLRYGNLRYTLLETTPLTFSRLSRTNWGTFPPDVCADPRKIIGFVYSALITFFRFRSRWSEPLQFVAAIRPIREGSVNTAYGVETLRSREPISREMVRHSRWAGSSNRPGYDVTCYHGPTMISDPFPSGRFFYDAFRSGLKGYVLLDLASSHGCQIVRCWM